MRRLYVLLAALVVAIVVALGTYAATSSARRATSAASPQNVGAVVAQGNQRLNTTQAALSNALAQQPPAANGGSVPFVSPHPVVVNVTGSASAVPFAAQTPHFGDEGGHGD